MQLVEDNGISDTHQTPCLTHACLLRGERERDWVKPCFYTTRKITTIQPNIQARRERKSPDMNVFIPFITVQPQPPPSHLGNQDFCVKTLPPDFLTMLSRKSDEINGNAQNQRHCQIFFSWERNCGRFYIFCSTPCHGQGLSFVVQF